MKKVYSIIAIIAFVLCSVSVQATHLNGMSLTYTYLNDSVDGLQTFSKYRITLTYFQDMDYGEPSSIEYDAPAFLHCLDTSGVGHEVFADYDLRITQLAMLSTTINSPCGDMGPKIRSSTRKIVFSKDYYLLENSRGYFFNNSRCCLSANIVNLMGSASQGLMATCSIPSTYLKNSSVVFDGDIPQALCINRPAVIDLSATDPDGDSVTYEFGAQYASPLDSDKLIGAYYPPFDTMNYAAPYSWQAPLSGSPAFVINPVSGIMTGTPTQTGRFLICVQYHEWRNGTMISTVNRSFVIETGPCATVYKPNAGDDRTVLVGDSVRFYGANASLYSWSPDTYLDNPNIASPIGHFTEVGDYLYILSGVTDSLCKGTDSVVVHVLPSSACRMPNAFTPNNDGLNDYLVPIPILGSKVLDFKVFNPEGRLLYEGGSDDKGWDGTFGGVTQNVGAYVWMVTYKDNTGAIRIGKGNVTLLR